VELKIDEQNNGHRRGGRGFLGLPWILKFDIRKKIFLIVLSS